MCLKEVSVHHVNALYVVASGPNVNPKFTATGNEHMLQFSATVYVKLD